MRFGSYDKSVVYLMYRRIIHKNIMQINFVSGMAVINALNFRVWKLDDCFVINHVVDHVFIL